jgi:hypothetical protein
MPASLGSRASAGKGRVWGILTEWESALWGGCSAGTGRVPKKNGLKEKLHRDTTLQCSGVHWPTLQPDVCPYE